MKIVNYFLYYILSISGFIPCSAQTSPKIFFREDWKEIEAALPVTQDHVANADLALSRYGPAKDAIKKSNHPDIPNDPYYIWSGECRGNWAVGLRHRNKMVDLTGDAKIKIRSKQSGFRLLRIIIKLMDGTWLVSNESAGFSDEWIEKEFLIGQIEWRELNIENITEGAWVQNPDLTRVVEVGFTDLMSGGGTPASSRLDWIEVYGKAEISKP